MKFRRGEFRLGKGESVFVLGSSYFWRKLVGGKWFGKGE